RAGKQGALLAPRPVRRRLRPARLPPWGLDPTLSAAPVPPLLRQTGHAGPGVQARSPVPGSAARPSVSPRCVEAVHSPPARVRQPLPARVPSRVARRWPANVRVDEFGRGCSWEYLARVSGVLAKHFHFSKSALQFARSPSERHNKQHARWSRKHSPTPAEGQTMQRRASIWLVLATVGLFALPASRAAELAGADFQPDPQSVQRYGPAYRYPQAGWIVLHIEGEPYERGYQHGQLLAPEIAAFLRCFATMQSPG